MVGPHLVLLKMIFRKLPDSGAGKATVKFKQTDLRPTEEVIRPAKEAGKWLSCRKELDGVRKTNSP